MKQLLSKIVPSSLLRFLAKQKYRKQNFSIHKENIALGHIARIVFKNRARYGILKELLLKAFGGVMQVDGYRFYYYPVAIIKTPREIEEYLKLIGAKSRNMNKKAQKSGIECREFEWNSKLDDIYEINTSSLVRQGRQMDQAYLEYPKRVELLAEGDFRIKHIGAFKEERLIGYIELFIYGNFAMTNRILGHKEYLKFGVMNLLFKEVVSFAIEDGIEYINYLTMENRENNSLSAFKYRVGFRDYSLLEME